jgi:hypothetical protein
MVKIPVGKTGENKGKFDVTEVSQKRSRDNSIFRFADNRPEADTQMKPYNFRLLQIAQLKIPFKNRE